MTNIFIDANVLVSVLNKEYPMFSDAARVMSLAEHRNFTLFTSPICLAIAFYFAEKKSGPILAKSKITTLLNHISITTTDQAVVKRAIDNVLVNDFEDGMQYYAALASNCKVIVTDDKDDYYYSEVQVLNCREMLEKVNSK